MRSKIADPAARGNTAGPAQCAPAVPTHPAGPGHLTSPGPRPAIAKILADSGLSDRSKRIAANLDDRCKAPGKWAAWPKVATIAADLGWDGGDVGSIGPDRGAPERSGRRRVERGFRELMQAGLILRMTLRELVVWFDSEGKAMGLAWPKELPRGIRLSLKVCVLLWRVPARAGGLPTLPECDTEVAPGRLPILSRCDIGDASSGPTAAPGVASPATQETHGAATRVSHSLLWNVRSLNGETTTDSSRTRGVPVGSSSSSDRALGAGRGHRETGRPGRGDGPRPLVTVLDRAMEKAVGPAREATPAAESGDDPARDALIAKVAEIAPGPENCEVRRAILDAAADLLKTARLAGSTSPFDHVRMAFEKAAANPKRLSSIESLARGIVRNWAREGFPAVVAPDPPGRPKPRPDPEADRRAAVERRRAAVGAEAEKKAAGDRWEAIPEAAKAELRAEFERALPRPPGAILANLWEVQRRDWCLWRMRRPDPA